MTQAMPTDSQQTESQDRPQPPRKRISGYEARSAPMSGWGGVLFGLPFALAGLGVILVATKVFPVNPSSVHVPMWVLGAVGLIFLLIGLWVMITCLRGLMRKARLSQWAVRHPDEPWFADFDWDRREAPLSSKSKALRCFATALFLVLFLIPFDYVGFVGGVLPFAIGSVVFNLIALLIAGNGVYLLVRQLKYGRSSLVLERFPCRLGETFEAHFINARGIGRYEKIAFTLRCIEEAYETTGHGKNRRTSTVGYELWSEQFVVDEPGEHPGGGEGVPITFLLPEGEHLRCRLSERPPRYWELEVKAATPGVDYAAKFLVPVY